MRMKGVTTLRQNVLMLREILPNLYHKKCIEAREENMHLDTEA